MKARQPSRTAEYNALFRALESAKPRQDRVLDDPLAVRLLSRPLRAVARAARFAGISAIVSGYIDRRQPGVRASVVARTCLIDGLVVAALGDGITQIVILGAGFDTRAHRIAGIERVRLFEVDHPNTSAAKRERLRDALGTLPGHVTYVEFTFGSSSLPDALEQAGFEPDSRTLFIWEGVTNYLSEEAVNATLAFIGRSPGGSRAVFTYVHKDILLHPGRYVGGNKLHRTLNKLEEQMTFGLDPEDVQAFVAVHGLRLVDDVGSVDYRARYLGAKGPHLRGHEFYRVAVVDVVDVVGNQAARIAGACRLGANHHS
jgi:methyltransferase (TIGR00027 family)